MNITILTKEQLRVINNRNLKYPLHIAEKDYFLTVVSAIIYDSPLRNKIIFKGGTALYHCYLPQLRFSEDLDFSANDKSIKIDDFKKVFKQYDFLEVKKYFVSNATIKIERLKYKGILDTPNSLKVETDFLQNTVLPPVNLKYNNVWNIETNARVMDIKEICAEKIRAVSGRIRYRDFYDLYMIFKNFKLDFNEIISLVKVKEVRETISKDKILDNWKVAKSDKSNESNVIYLTESIDDVDIGRILNGFSFTLIKKQAKT